MHSSLRFGGQAWTLFVLILAGSYIAFRTGINYSANWIWERPEYGHGMLIPFISAFLVWQRREDLSHQQFRGSWFGVLLLAVAFGVNFVGKLSALYIIQQYSAVIAFYGLVMALVGVRLFVKLAVPLILLFFMIPLPEFLYKSLSAHLQLISSYVGVWFVRLFGISVFLEGNVIDLGNFKLQVAEACDGLRYLFPLMTIGFIMAYFYQAPLWKRAILFASSVPVTVLMNSFRIGTIGVMVEHWGIGMAEGFLHQFQGWAVFMVSVSILLVEMALLSRFGSGSKEWRSLFHLDLPRAWPANQQFSLRSIPHPVWGSAAVVAIGAVLMSTIPERRESIPPRTDFTSFPLHLHAWSGRAESMEKIYLDQLMLDDYIIANYSKPDSPSINFYVAWYNSQRAGRSAHSPRSCLPAGGWEIQEFSQVIVPGVVLDGQPLRVNRALIQLGSQRQLVYYWFQQRGRVVTNEYSVKWFMFWDSLTRNRTDGALVRVTTSLGTADSVAAADSQLSEFVGAAVQQLHPHLPS